MKDDGKLYVIVDEVLSDVEELVVEVRESCLVDVIDVY